ncbi:putative mitochondrial transporter UCP3 isoform X1 [Bemisia tabaci]|uniref:putative mitochondrial transporter UCP3 isoform X1 n=1 Tax=Bemisia tabaci TaxID=7038 RepID=UPI003B280624
MVVPEELPLSFKVAAAGSAACFADFITFPLDTAKVRLQVQGESKVKATELVSKSSQKLQYRGLIGTIATIAKKEGPKSLFNGLSAGLQRQLCFASVRLGFYDSVKSLYIQLFYGKSQNNGMAILPRVCAGMTTGGLAVLLAQPTDVVKVRFQAQQSAKAAPKYLSTLQAYRTIAREEGAAGLWKGCATNASRNAIVNVSEIVCYDIIKEAIITNGLLKDGIPCHFTSAVIADVDSIGTTHEWYVFFSSDTMTDAYSRFDKLRFCATLVASPVDVVKTRYMNAPPGNYSGALDCAAKMFKSEGFSAFYKGFTPSFFRLVSWNIVLWLSYEQIKIVITDSKYFKDRQNVN